MRLAMIILLVVAVPATAIAVGQWTDQMALHRAHAQQAAWCCWGRLRSPAGPLTVGGWTPGRPGGGRAGRSGAATTAEALRHGVAASTTQTGPRANVMVWPDVVVNVVPPLASGRDQRMA